MAKNPKSYGGGPTIGSSERPSKITRNFQPKGFGNSPTLAAGHRANKPGGSGEVYPHAYGGAPTMHRDGRTPKKAKGQAGGAQGGNVTQSPSFDE